MNDLNVSKDCLKSILNLADDIWAKGGENIPEGDYEAESTFLQDRLGEVRDDAQTALAHLDSAIMAYGDLEIERDQLEDELAGRD